MCVLLVEDEPLIREIMVECLEEAGYEVLGVETGEQAAAIIDNPPKSLIALVTDFHMPGTMDGRQVAVHARSASPNIPVVLVSGRPDVFQAAWGGDGYRFLKKPYLPSQLIELIQCLTRPAPCSSC